jgi:hypothetical protein
MDNIQLPADLLKEIDVNANAYLGTKVGAEFSMGAFDGYITGATEYAAKLHDRDRKIELLIKSRHNQIEFIDKAIALLEKVIARHEAGLLPDRFIYHEIKNFLDGK